MINRQTVNFIKLRVCIVSILVGLVLFAAIGQFEYNFQLHAQSMPESVTSDNVVILNFEDGRKSRFIEAKPILDKYGFKATFYVVCNYLGNKPGYMDWSEVRQLYKEGNDVGSHSMNHFDVEKLSKKDLKFEIAGSKNCLEQHGIHATSFAYPFNRGSEDNKVIKGVSKYYDLARTADSPITYLHCDGWKQQSDQNDCRTYASKKDLTFANRYSIRGWSHDKSRLVNSYSDGALFKQFVQVVNSQSKYNEGGTIKAVPIIIYHRAGDTQVVDYNTDPKLFEKEMKYLHDNNFRVITMKDLAFNTKSNYLYIKSNSEPLSGGIASVSKDN